MLTVIPGGACKRQPYGAKGVDLAVENWSKRCTPFALYIHQKVHTFCLQNWLKGVLAEKKKKKNEYWLAQLFPQKEGKRCTPFVL